jgi:hypothetical protein
MSEAFVDTTVLVDILLKPGAVGAQSRRALQAFDTTQLPVYALKEMRMGALRYVIWLHNNLATFESVSRTTKAIAGMIRTPQRNLASTAVEALSTVQEILGRESYGKLAKMYGSKANQDNIDARRYRLAARRLILNAWKERRSVTSTVVEPLECFDEVAIAENGKHLKVSPAGCQKASTCSLGKKLAHRLPELQSLAAAVASLKSPRLEDKRRLTVLRDFIRKPKEGLSHQACRSIGDAYFAVFAPPGSVIVTTNLKDHAVLAEALGKAAQTPFDDRKE